MESISDSVFRIFKIGPGPSSSHTLGPMAAAREFLTLGAADAAAAAKVQVKLYGSLSSTGPGHGTAGAVTAGLLGYAPEECPPTLLNEIAAAPDAVRKIRLGDREFALSLSDVIFAGDLPGAPHPNTCDFELLDGADRVIRRWRCCSVGGGEIRFENAPAAPTPPTPTWPYHNLRSFRKLVERTGLSPAELLYANEEKLTGLSRAAVDARLDRVLEAMNGAVERGLHTAGVLPGTLRVAREAPDFLALSEAPERSEFERSTLYLSACSLAAAEENAAGNVVVTAPTSGSAGVIPGVVALLRRAFRTPPELLRSGLMIAALFGLVTRRNGSISGAEVGCQGEIGVAAAMAAALIAHCRGGKFATVENAAEIALEHHLGMTCDPIGGYVQIPCIERCAVAANTAFTAWLLSCGNPGLHKLDFDAVVEVMLETGLDMNSRYKETAAGGLASCPLRC